jgi:hypothetical protein
MKCTYACKSPEHQFARRNFMGSLAAAGGAVVGGLGVFSQQSIAEQLQKDQKRVLVVNMAGGLSQLESWDPKPGTKTGGPFRAIPSSVPGMYISELLPQTAQQMHHMALARGVNTRNNDHGKGTYMMMTGRRQTPASNFPRIGAVVSKALGADKNSLPGHIHVSNGGGSRNNDAAYLGPMFASVTVGSGTPPNNSARPDGLTEASDLSRNSFRRKVNENFTLRRRTAVTDIYTQNYERAIQLMQKRDVFDLAKESDKDHERYGKHQFGQHCLMARRLLENGVTFVQVTHSNYDTHNENFNFHHEQLGEVDGPFASLIADLVDRGMWESTLVVVLSEFGRTPNINKYYGRDHWGTAWTICMGGAGLQRGAVYGETNKEGTAVTDGEVDQGPLFHTYLEALGIDSSGTFDIGGRPVPVADPAFQPIKELLA